MTIGADKDNTLYETPGGTISNGAGEFFFAGRTGPNAGSLIRRGVIAFDIAGSVPAGATITGAVLTLNVSREQNANPVTIELHRLLADWGEGASNAGTPGGAGAAATTGDATWIHTFHNTSTWTTAGGDFAPSASASLSVSGLGPRSWTGPNLVADVQSWLDSPSGNFGWIMIAEEVTLNSARRFDSRESPTMSLRPQLVIDYTE